MNHNDMKRNNGMRDTMSATRGRHGSGGFAIRQQRMILTQGDCPLVRADEITAHSPRHYGSLPTTLRLVVTRSGGFAIRQQRVSGFAIRLLLIMVMLTLGLGGAWGQTDYSGVYYIGVYGKNATSQCASSDPADNFYLCPTEGWCYYDGVDNGIGQITNEDNGQPFLTSYKCRDGVYDATKAIWVITKNGDYYYIQQQKTGKYLVFNPQLAGAGENRVRVHFETITSPAVPDDYALFAISTVTTSDDRNGYWVFHPKKASNGYYLNITDGNVNSVSTPSNGKTDGPSGYKNVGGIVGQWNETNNTSSYYLEIPKPVISQGSDKTISITHPFGNDVKIYYTTDGTDPTISSDPYTGAIPPAIDVSQIKAIATNTNQTVESAVATFNLEPCPLPTIHYDNDTKEITISSTLSGATVYYTIAADNPSDPNFSTETHSTEPITIPNITSKTVVKAFAAKQGYAPSAIKTQIVDKVATPVFDTSSGNSIVITCATEGVTIYYTDDNSEPSTSWSIYRRPLTDGISGKSFRAFATKANNITSDVAGPSSPITLRCATPVIKRGSGNTFTLSCSFPSEGVTIYYTTNGADLEANPTSGTAYIVNTEIPFTGTSVTVKAIAVANNYNNSALAERTITEALSGAGTAGDPYLIESSGDFAQFIINANGTESGKYYKVTGDFTVGITDAITKAFTGTFDGGYFTISGLQKPLFNTVNGGTVKNVVLNPDGIVSGNGAICNEADGNTKIYNCGVLSGTISGSGNVGGLVGHINSGSNVRVVNCYNFATVSGGSTMAGIVGNNEGTVGDVRIAMCMMYGEMAGTSPVYAGNHNYNNSDFNEYNYWRYRSGLSYSVYNDQLAIEKDEYLTRFPFYRHILNSHRELAAYFLFGTSPQTVSDITDAQVSEIGHWVLKKDVAPYPIVEKWEINTTKTLDAADDAKNVLTNMGSGGYLSVTVIIDGTSYPVSLPITDMDEANYDYTWGKVVLPFANEFVENNDYSRICTGWKITNVPGGNGGTFENFNVSDRDCTTKDLYETTGFIFAQGGYYVVPYNVTEIEITANFATAYYLRDEAYDISYSGDKTGNDASGYIGRTGHGGSTSSTYQEQHVYNTLASALNDMSASGSTHEQAVVLVGNYHQDAEDLSSLTSKGLTIMSIDADNNQEPDYAWYSNNTQDRPAIPPTRFDFVALIPLGMSSRVHNTTFYPNIPIWKPRGWFEMTETSLSRMDQFELNSNNFDTSSSDTRNYRCIINGGYFTQMVRSRKAACNKVKYYQIGGKAYIKEFYPGSHSADSYGTVLCPINVTGGEIEQCFMTGYGKGTAVGSDIYFWCAGGKIDKFLGAYMENPSTAGVNMTAKIDHAKIGRFFGGGTSPNAQITGNINVTINNSTVDFYCGGPEFGDMSNGKTVTTHANNTTFGEYYGAGFGGTAITYSNDEDDTKQGLGNASHPTVTYPSSFFTNHFVAERLKNRSKGIGSCYKFEFIFNSRGAGSVARFYTGYVKFSLATTGSVTNVLDGCTLLGDFYGAGCQGKVSGTVTSTLTGCTVNRSAFGGGYKAENNIVDVYPTTEPTMSVYTRETGIFSDFGTIAPVQFKWKHNETGHAAGSSVDADSNGQGGTLYTDVTLSDLGNVTGAISITINGGTVAEDVFGGGNESKSLNNTTVNLKGDAHIGRNVFGGGNNAEVGGKAEVNIMVP